MRETEPVFPERFNLKLPKGFNRALSAAAARQHTTSSEFVRRALLRELEANGSPLVAGPSEVPANVSGNAVVEEARALVARITEARREVPA